jgi:hypothetical protein
LPQAKGAQDSGTPGHQTDGDQCRRIVEIARDLLRIYRGLP